MKTKKTVAFLSFVCIIFICTALCSCADADITVLHGEKIVSEDISTESEEEKFTLTVNISSGTFHLNDDCRYAVNIKEENKKMLLYSDVRTAVEAGYPPCSACAGEYKD